MVEEGGVSMMVDNNLCCGRASSGKDGADTSLFWRLCARHKMSTGAAELFNTKGVGVTWLLTKKQPQYSTVEERKKLAPVVSHNEKVPRLINLATSWGWLSRRETTPYFRRTRGCRISRLLYVECKWF